MILDKQNGLNLCRLKNGQFDEDQKLFVNEFISDAIQTKSGILFLGTFKQGIIVVPSIEFIGNESTSLFTSIRAYDDDNYVVSKRNGEILGHLLTGSSGELVKKIPTHIDQLFVLKDRFSDGSQWGKILELRYNSVRNALDLGRGDLSLIHI